MTQDEWDWNDDDQEQPDQEEELDPETGRKVTMAMQRLRNFQYDLADDMVMTRINKELNSIPFTKFIHYYRKKSDETDLAALTINNELNRMDYEVVYRTKKTKDKDEIRTIFGKTSEKEIWCLANQSIYGDILTTLQMYFLSSELCITISNSDSHFVIDVDSDCLHSESTFTIGCNKMIELATIKSSITVSLKDEAIKQVLYSPELKMVFDQDLREAAIAVVEIEGTYQSYQMRERARSSSQGGRDSLRNKIENIDIEAVRERLLETSHIVIGHVGGFLTKLPVVSNIIDNLAEEDESERVIDFTDTTGLGDDQENYYSDSADDEPAPVNVKAIAGTLFQWGGAIGSNIVNGIGSIVDRVSEESRPQQLYRKDSESSKKGLSEEDKSRKSSFISRRDSSSSNSYSNSNSKPVYSDLPAPASLGSDPDTLHGEGNEEKVATSSSHGDTGTVTDLLDFGGGSDLGGETATSTAEPQNLLNLLSEPS